MKNIPVLCLTVLALACGNGTSSPAGKNAGPYDASVIAASGLVLRAGPSSSSDKIMLLKTGTVVRVLSNGSREQKIDGIRAPWLYCSYKERTGWVFGGFVRRHVAGHDKPTGLALDLAPGLIFATFGKTVATVEKLLGKAQSVTETTLTAGNSLVTQRLLVYPGIKIGLSESLEMQTVHYLKLDASAPPAIAAKFNIGQPVAILSNLVNPRTTSVSDRFALRTDGRMEVKYAITNALIAGFEYMVGIE